MKKSDVYEIAVKLFGVYLIVPTLYAFGNLLSYLLLVSSALNNDRQSFGATIFIGGAAVFFILIVVSALFIFRTRMIVRIITNDADTIDEVKLFASKKTIYEIAIFLTGGLLFLWSLPELCFDVYNYMETKKNGMQWLPGQAQALTIHALKILCGIIIVLSADIISSFFAKDRVIPAEDLE